MPAQPPFLFFDKLTAQDGLSHNKVNCILRDQRGFMWFGTNDGLNRYDGHNFLVFQHRPGDSTSISGNIINDILEDEQGVLWIATADGGLTRYDHRQAPSRQFRQYRHLPGNPGSLPINILNKLLLDDRGFLWIGTGGAGLLRFDRLKEKFIEPVPRSTRTILDMKLDSSGVLWVGRVGGGMLKVNTHTLQHETDAAYDDLYAKLPHVAITAIHTDDRQQVWFGSWDKFLYRRAANGRETVFQQSGNAFTFTNDELSCFATDAKGRLWMGGRMAGLHIYDHRSGRFYNYRYDPAREGTIADNRINCLYNDGHGIIWVGTNRGISIHRPAQQQFAQCFLPRLEGKEITIYDFYDRKGDLWVGTSEGIFIRPTGSDAFIHKPLRYRNYPLRVTKIYEDVDGALYLGTDYSLFLLDIDSWQVTLLPNTDKDRVMNRVIESRIVSIVRDTIGGHPVLLTAPYGHFITYYDLTDKRWVSRHDTVRNIIDSFRLGDNNLIRKIYKGRNGRLWLTSVSDGLGMNERNNIPAFRFFSNDSGSPEGISSNHVFDLQEDGAGRLWVSTYGGGLHWFNPQSLTFTHVPVSNNLLEGIQVDARGQVWMISNGNIHKYDPQRRAYVSFELPDIDKSGGVRGDIFKDQKGRFYVAGANYFIAFDPIGVRETRQTPQVFFTDFKVFNESNSELLQEQHIRLRYGQNYFTVEFAAPDYSASRSLHYSYMLEGRDRDWIDIGSRNTLEFSNLEAKDYVLKVRATAAGLRNEEVATLLITIIPPVWQRWWFYALCGFSIGVIFYFIYKYRFDQLLKQQAIRNKIAQDLHDNVGSTLSSISVYSQVAKIYHEQNRGKDLKQALEKISETSVEMISEMNDIVWTINPRHDSMDTILQRMESFARPLLASQGIHFHFEVDPGVNMLNLEMTRRKNFYLIYKEAINNALKYAQCKNLWVKIGVRQHHLFLVATDDGIGFDPATVQLETAQSLSGNGLRNMEMRAEEMRGRWKIDSLAGKGTTVHLRFPIV
ncbi:sensor histidine kinase [Paraflavitalea sp. CAU 1676]|uniref:ligand-binding sensor domain-containing protein n=1 Tax=Paraflavitalea sp. CAU 1676 TaxID=3032598 RepID=UPI0023D9C482|nr:sensor histidine kinase [Paraflavitalea sp. CAU 1676]MDF2193618.1 two-component regulator propeller domain-containing protein [Paraflavitalea sp. CAU 1676]